MSARPASTFATGRQLQCIGCGLCIDACNNVMTKLDRPNWLITWDNLVRQTAKIKREPVPEIRFLRPRTLIYAFVLFAGAAGMAYAVTNRSELIFIVLHDRAPLFVRLADGTLRNGYTLSVINKRPTVRKLQISLKGISGAELALPESSVETASTVDVAAKADAVTDVRVLVRAPASVHGKVPVSFVLRDTLSGTTEERTTTFLAPSANGE